MQPDQMLKCTCRCTCRSTKASNSVDVSDIGLDSKVSQKNSAFVEVAQKNERERLIAHLEEQSHQINAELERLQLEGILTNAAIQAMRKHTSSHSDDQDVHHHSALPHSDAKLYDDCVSTHVCTQGELDSSIAQQSNSKYTIENATSRMNSPALCQMPEQQACSTSIAHSWQAECSNVNQELTTLRSRQTLLASRIQSLQDARKQLLQNLNRLLQTEVTANSSTKVKTCQSTKCSPHMSSSNYEYLFNATKGLGNELPSSSEDLCYSPSRVCKATKPSELEDKQKRGYSTLNDQECQTDFPMAIHSNALYDYISASGQQTTKYESNGNSQSLHTKGAIKPMHDFGVQSTTMSALAAVAAVAAASFLSKTMKHTLGGQEVQTPQRPSDQLRAPSTEQHELRQGASQPNPNSDRVASSDMMNPQTPEFSMCSNPPSLQYSPSSTMQRELDSVYPSPKLKLDPTVTTAVVRRNTFELELPRIPQARPQAKGVQKETLSPPSLPSPFPYSKFPEVSHPTPNVMNKTSNQSPAEATTPPSRICSRFSERLQLARRYVDELYCPKTTSSVKASSSPESPSAPNCLSKEVLVDDYFIERQACSCVQKCTCSSFPGCQYQFSKNVPNFPQKQLSDEILCDLMQMPSTSVSYLQPTLVQVVKPAMRTINAADSSGFDTGSPSDSDDLSGKSAQVLIRARAADYLSRCTVALDSSQPEEHEKERKPKGVLISESTKGRRQRDLQKSNGPQRTVVWEDELYNDLKQATKEEATGSVSAKKVSNHSSSFENPTFNLPFDTVNKASTNQLEFGSVDANVHRRTRFFSCVGCDDHSMQHLKGFSGSLGGQSNCDKPINNNSVVRRSLPDPGKLPVKRSLHQ